jgi:cytoskeletal protein RodZ
MIEENKNSGKDNRKKKSSHPSLLDSLPERKHRDWLPFVVLSVILTIFLICSLRLICLFFYASPEPGIVPKTAVKEIAPAKPQVKQEKKERRKLKNPFVKPYDKKIAKIQENPPVVSPSGTDQNPVVDNLVAFYPLNGNAYDDTGRS